MEHHSTQQKHPNVVYIISQNFTAPHIEKLITELQRQQIPLQLQSDHQTLGVPLDRRYFVVVDNLSGTVTLDPWFNSLLLFIVGYPKKGHNKKNHYCNTIQQVINKYQQFSNLPEFAKKIYLSSSVTSRSVLKSARSFSSNTKTGSDSQKIKKDEKIYFDQMSKLFLYSSQTDLVFNKWIFKIAANNPKKIQVVESVSDLELALSACRCKTNFLLITSVQYEEITKQCANQLKIILYGKNITKIPNNDDILGVCHTQTEIILMLRKYGFQVVSLRDIEKSIVRYNNPFAKQLKSKSGKKIIWGSNSASDSDGEKLSESLYKIQISTLTQHQINKPEGEVPISVSEQIHSISSIAQTPWLNPIELEKKRSSIENQVKFNETSKKLTQIQLEKEKKTQKGSYTSAIVIEKEHNVEKDNNNHNDNLAFEKHEKRPLKIKKLKCKSLCQKKLKSSESIELVEQKSPVRKFQDHYFAKVSQNQTCSLPFEKKKLGAEFYYLSNQSLSLKEQSVNQLTISLQESMDLKEQTEQKNEQNNKKQSVIREYKLNKQQIGPPIWLKKRAWTNSPEIVYRKDILHIEKSRVRRRSKQERERKEIRKVNKIDSVLLIWKDFSYNIGISREYLVRQFGNNYSFTDQLFYSQREFQRILSSSQPKVNLVLLLDEVDIEEYVEICRNSPAAKYMTGIYVFEKENKLSISRFESLKREIRSWENEGKDLILRCITISDYIDQNKEIVHDLTALGFTPNNI